MAFINHVAIYVNNLEEEKEFYTKYFGAVSNSIYRNMNTGFSSYFLSFPEGCRLELMHFDQMQNEEKTPRRTGFIHIAISVGSKDNVDSLTEKLRNDGYEIFGQPRTTGDGCYESCVLDPERNQVEITI